MPKVVSIYDRQKEFEGDGLYIFDARSKIMMCKFCNIRIDWSRKDSIMKHIRDSSKHINNVQKSKIIEGSSNHIKRQLSMPDSINNAKKVKQEKEELICDTVGALIIANIPLEKFDDPNFRAWMNKYIPGAGDIPTADTCRATYAPRVAEKRKDKIKASIKGQPVAIMCDETTDRKGWCVFILLLRVLSCSAEQKIFVGAVKMLLQANATECSRVVMTVIQEFDIPYDNVVALVTDSARCTTLCAQMCNVLCPTMVHAQCWAHKLNLAANLFSSELQHLHTCMSNGKMVFLNIRKRKHRYISFIKERYPDDDLRTTSFPSPVMTRWNSWYKSAHYIGEHIQDMVDFSKTVDEGGAAVKYFTELEQQNILIITASAAFLKEHGQQIIDSIVTLEGSSYPFSHKLQSRIDGLLNNFKVVSKGLLGSQTTSAINSLKSMVRRGDIKQPFENLGSLCESKLTRLLISDTARVFTSNMGKLLDEKNIIENSETTVVQTAASIPLLKKLESTVLFPGYLCIQSIVKQKVQEGENVNVLNILLSIKGDHSELVESCVMALWVPCSNFDSERAISSYGNTLSDLRTNASPETLEMQLNVYFGSAWN